MQDDKAVLIKFIVCLSFRASCFAVDFRTLRESVHLTLAGSKDLYQAIIPTKLLVREDSRFPPSTSARSHLQQIYVVGLCLSSTTAVFVLDRTAKSPFRCCGETLATREPHPFYPRSDTILYPSPLLALFPLMLCSSCYFCWLTLEQGSRWWDKALSP